MLPRLNEVLFTQTIFVEILRRPVLQSGKERLGSTKQNLGVLDLLNGKATPEQIHCTAGEINTLLDVVDQVDLSVGVWSVDVGELNGGTAVAAIKEDSEPCFLDHWGNYDSVKLITVDLAMRFEVNGANCIIESNTLINMFYSFRSRQAH